MGYHFVWATKYRYHVLRGEVAERCRELIRQRCLARDLRIVRGHVSRDHVSRDHVHLLLSCPPTFAPAKVMQYLKGRSSRLLQPALAAGSCSRLLQQEFPHLNKRYWGLNKRYWGRHMWARGYFCATVGQVSEEQIREYIERHDEEPPSRDFSIEDFSRPPAFSSLSNLPAFSR